MNPYLKHNSHGMLCLETPLTKLSGIAHSCVALLRAVSRLLSTPSPASNIVSSPGVGKSADAARRNACATPRGSNVCEKCGLAKRGTAFEFPRVYIMESTRPPNAEIRGLSLAWQHECFPNAL